MPIADELRANYRLFASIRERFTTPGTERGGHVRVHVTPVYVRKFGTHAATIFPNLTSVEASFTAEQLTAINQATLLLKGWMNGAHGHPNLTQRTCEHFRQTTRPYFALALLRSTEQLLSDCIDANPLQAPAFDALFRVAGSEGFRDLIQMYGTRLLGQTMQHQVTALPDILGFVNLHQRPSSSEQYEVWCPGHDFAKVFYEHSQAAAQQLIDSEQLQQVTSREAELRALPSDMVHHLTTFVHQQARRVLAAYGVVA